MLRKRICPLSWDRSTSFMVMASTSGTEGKGLPLEIGVPTRASAFPPLDTEVPGFTDALSTGGFG
jgi:hypothetical protein